MLPNSVFKNFPIEFKEINKEDFEGEYFKPFNVKDKIIIEPDSNGYIFESLHENINLEDNETLVINAPVGCGKSYAILKLIAKIYLEEPNSKIIVAPPFVSLIEQYCIDINSISGVPKSLIYDYSDLGRHPKVSYEEKRVHVVTVNTLLGNPGEDGFKNSEAKRQYLRDIILESRKYNQKVYFIYDEIHDAISNFKEEYLFNLWNWEGLVHKNILISATYNEASKVVIKYLAELTDKNIKIIEAPRRAIPNKQSKLHLHYCSDFNFTVTTGKLVSVIETLISKNKNIDILCYSKTLAKSIIKDKEGIGKKLTEKFGYINDCTSELVSNQRGPNEPPKNRYDNDACNVGTNFKSGVNIVKKNHAYVIILPPRATRLPYRNMSGIFSDGIVGLVQAIARQRTQGEIHIILPKPDKFYEKSLTLSKMNQLQIDTFMKFYSRVQYISEGIRPVSYLPLKMQEELLYNFYHEVLLPEVEVSIKRIKNREDARQREGLPRLAYPPYEIFKLDKGEDYLANSYQFYGEDLASYITYCAFTNQFINCNLVYLNNKNALFFEEGKIQQGLLENFHNHLGVEYYESLATYSNFGLFYQSIRNNLFNNFSLLIKKDGEERWTAIKESKNPEFEKQLLKFCIKIFKDGTSFYNRVGLEDEDYTRSSYLLDCISYAEKNPQENNLTKAYHFLGILRRRLISNINKSTSGKEYISIAPNDKFIKATEMERLHTSLRVMMEEDLFIKNDVFTFRRNLMKKDSSKQLASIYKILVEDFFITEVSKVQILKKRENVKVILKTHQLPDNKLSPIMKSDLEINYLDALWEIVSQMKDEKGHPKFENLEQYFELGEKFFDNNS